MPRRDPLRDAACRDADPRLFLPAGGRPSRDRVAKAAAICAECTVRPECLLEREPYTPGIWGGVWFQYDGTAVDIIEYVG